MFLWLGRTLVPLIATFGWSRSNCVINIDGEIVEGDADIYLVSDQLYNYEFLYDPF